MAWTCTASKNLSGPGGNIIVTLEYTDGKRIIREAFDVQGFTTKEWFQDRAKNKIEWLEARDAALATIADGVITPVGFTTVKNPTAEETPKQLYAKKLNTYKQILRAVDVGIVVADTKQQTDLLAWLKTNFIADYIDLF